LRDSAALNSSSMKSTIVVAGQTLQSTQQLHTCITVLLF